MTWTTKFSVFRRVLLTVPIILKEGKHGSKEKKVFLFLFCLGFSPIKLETLWKVSFYLNNDSHAVCVEDSKLRNRVEVKKDLHNNQKCQLPFKIDIHTYSINWIAYGSSIMMHVSIYCKGSMCEWNFVCNLITVLSFLMSSCRVSNNL